MPSHSRLALSLNEEQQEALTPAWLCPAPLHPGGKEVTIFLQKILSSLGASRWLSR